MLVALLLTACQKDPEPNDPMTPPFTPPGSGVITLETRDGVALEADYYPQDQAGAPALVLLHMVPPSNDRTNWPASFIEALYDEGFTVLVPDRRGAGGSEGVASEAHEGPKGKFDVEAAALRVRDDGYGDLGLLGASNGTTSMLDYTLWASGEGNPVPVALGFMTGGGYTENQNEMAELRARSPEIPAIFTYSTAERAWSVAQQEGAPSSWVFHEYEDGEHGTRMFEVAPEVGSDLVAFLRDALL